ncbi:hypothetical protein JOL62DRAFT_607493 [Phyllosticta paracitricarpa]|uniref:Uncharacterized protein n=1 Tax=Phyllosticta paracitricarpa TaxID=2016321 RepID=A0ABR1MSY3_9PEZI
MSYRAAQSEQTQTVSKREWENLVVRQKAADKQTGRLTRQQESNAQMRNTISVLEEDLRDRMARGWGGKAYGVANRWLVRREVAVMAGAFVVLSVAGGGFQNRIEFRRDRQGLVDDFHLCARFGFACPNFEAGAARVDAERCRPILAVAKAQTIWAVLRSDRWQLTRTKFLEIYGADSTWSASFAGRIQSSATKQTIPSNRSRESIAEHSNTLNTSERPAPLDTTGSEKAVDDGMMETGDGTAPPDLNAMEDGDM